MDIAIFEKYYVPEPNSGCWIWIRALDSGGYGRVFPRKINGKRLLKAHRISYELFKGSIPEGLDLDHLCRVRCCVNPDHLEPVTRSENCLRGETGHVSGARKRARTHCIHGHEFTPENTWVYKGERHCIQCRRESTRRWRRKSQNQ